MSQRAFSLVELSIVLVILGLLVGGILAGQSLIRAAELRAVTSEYQRYVTAHNVFYDKYFGIPGDLRNATSIWGTATTCPGTQAEPSTTIATCNGNNDGIIGWPGGAPYGNETTRYWQHLANAGLVEGQYTGVRASSPNEFSALPGSNIPKSRAGNNVGWSIWSWGVMLDESDGSFFQGNNNNQWIVGNYVAGTHTEGFAFKPEEMWNMDTKIDDGKPGMGAMRLRKNWSGCYTGTATATAAAYALNSTTVACAILFRIP